MKPHIIDDLRPEDPDIDPAWTSTTMRTILGDRGPGPTRAAVERRSGLTWWSLVAATVAVLVGGMFVARDHLPRNDVRPAGPASQAPVPTTPTPTSPHPQKALKTYVPAPGDPKTHVLRITILDKGLEYDPSTCAALTSFGFIGFSGPSRHYEGVPVGDAVPIPAQAEARSDGTCAATMTVTLPYRPRYEAGVGQEGQGISDPEVDPDQTKIETRGDSQDVTLVNYRVD